MYFLYFAKWVKIRRGIELIVPKHGSLTIMGKPSRSPIFIFTLALSEESGISGERERKQFSGTLCSSFFHEMDTM